MANINCSDARTGNTVNQLPVLSIPEYAAYAGHAVNNDGSAGATQFYFEINTDTGLVCVGIFENRVVCLGNKDALVSAKIISGNWIVAGFRSWCVLLNETFPQIRRGGKGRPIGQYASITKCFDEYRVCWRAPREQRDAFLNLVKARKPKPKKDEHHESKPNTSAECLNRCNKYCDLFEHLISREITNNRLVGFMHDRGDFGKISKAFAELRDIFSEAERQAILNLRQDGNVIYPDFIKGNGGLPHEPQT